MKNDYKLEAFKLGGMIYDYIYNQKQLKIEIREIDNQIGYLKVMVTDGSKGFVHSICHDEMYNIHTAFDVFKACVDKEFPQDYCRNDEFERGVHINPARFNEEALKKLIYDFCRTLDNVKLWWWGMEDNEEARIEVNIRHPLTGITYRHTHLVRICNNMNVYREFESFKRCLSRRTHQFDITPGMDINSMCPKTIFKDLKFMDCCDMDAKMIRAWYERNAIKEKEKKMELPKIEKVMFNDPATVVFWKDDTKTVVKAGEGEVYDPEKGLAMAIAKKALGNNHDYYNVFKRNLKKAPKVKTPNPGDVRINHAQFKNLEATYHTLVSTFEDHKATKSDMIETMDVAIGTIGEILGGNE